MRGLPKPPILEKGCLLLCLSRGVLAEGLPLQRSYNKSQNWLPRPAQLPRLPGQQDANCPLLMMFAGSGAHQGLLWKKPQLHHFALTRNSGDLCILNDPKQSTQSRAGVSAHFFWMYLLKISSVPIPEVHTTAQPIQNHGKYNFFGGQKRAPGSAAAINSQETFFLNNKWESLINFACQFLSFWGIPASASVKIRSPVSVKAGILSQQ